MISVVAFITGIAVGYASYRKIIADYLGRNPMSKCDYCEFKREKEKLFPQRK